MQLHQAAAEVDPAASAVKATMTGGGLLSVGGLTANNVAIAVGAVIAVAGFLMQWYYQRQRNLREEEARREARELFRLKVREFEET